MIKVLFVARYRDATMHRKVELLGEQADLSVCQVYPLNWQDELIRVEQSVPHQRTLRRQGLALIGRPSDPHRALFRTLTFGIRQFKPDIIHAEEEPDSFAAIQIILARRLWAPRAKLLVYSWQNVNRRRRWYVRWVLQTALDASNAVLCANQEAVTVLRQQGFRKEAAVLPAIGVDTRIFRPCPQCAEGRKFTVGYIGRLVVEKGVDTLLEAMAVLASDTELLVVGEGSHRQALHARARALGLGDRVCFLGPVHPAQVAQHLCRLDALVLPSRTTPVWKEQFGRILVEAMACRIPVIGSDSGAIPEVIGDAGLIFPEGDAALLAASLRRLIESASLRHDLAERGYARVMRFFTQEKIAEQTAGFYRQIMGR